MGRIDDLDVKILSELSKDASISVPRLSKKINVNSSVVYSRIKRLVKRGLIRKFTHSDQWCHIVPHQSQD